ncbi:MAG: PIN domain-containing protein [Trueperaceae bacterium]|nr:MAG: PIN domain-containing protein [Trueperaceae bacterium]UCH27240.1 MAG: PIN domain-containing protein [Trueperaceae bacterium]
MIDRIDVGALVRGYEALIETLELPDPDDRHVLAAALHARAGVIVTQNLKDFPEDILEPLGVVALSPDRFISSLLAADVGLVCKAVRDQRLSLTKPSHTVKTLLATLESLGLEETTKTLRMYQDGL